MYTASWRDVVRRDLFGQQPDRRDRPYRFVIRAALIIFRLFHETGEAAAVVRAAVAETTATGPRDAQSNAS